MILSFHPLIEKDENRLCAGRLPDAGDLAAIRSADAVVLPQGCYQSLYVMARENCRHIFPNYDARFAFPGKTGQALLFQKTGVPHPATQIFNSVAEFTSQGAAVSPDVPAVFKFDWGGEGETVFHLQCKSDLSKVLAKARGFEKTGQQGFILQEYIPTAARSLRVVVVGRHLLSYWRVAPERTAFSTGLSTGGRIDKDLAPDLQNLARNAVARFCDKTGINLAGFDILFRADDAGRMTGTPLFLEINYFFGRRGLGGSEAYYKLFYDAVEMWLESIKKTETDLHGF